MSHTKTPWIFNASNGTIEAPEHHDRTICLMTTQNAVGLANAAHIVRCVNSHAALVEALEAAQEKLTIYREHSDGSYKGGMEHHALMEKIKAALALEVQS